MTLMMPLLQPVSSDPASITPGPWHLILNADIMKYICASPTMTWQNVRVKQAY